MNTQIFCIWDSAAHRYLDPFCAPTIEFAIREFRKAVNKPDHQFNLYPEDYTLFHIGEFLPEEGVLVAGKIHSLGVAQTFIEQIKIPYEQDLEEDGRHG